MRGFVAVLVGLTIAVGIVFMVKRRTRRRRADELLKHPERLDQMLDDTDDA